jgi:hypothetical protein
MKNWFVHWMPEMNQHVITTYAGTTIAVMAERDKSLSERDANVMAASWEMYNALVCAEGMLSAHSASCAREIARLDGSNEEEMVKMFHAENRVLQLVRAALRNADEKEDE